MATTAHEGELQPWAALDGPVSHQLRRSLACLAHTDVFVRGFSEARQLVGWLHAAFGPHGCTGGSPDVVDTCTRRLTPPGQAFPPSHLHRNLSRCRDRARARRRRPYTSYCSEHDVTLSFEWKSFQFTPHDESFHTRVRAAAAASPGRRVIAILSGGPHHFSKFKDHKHAMYFSLPDLVRDPTTLAAGFCRLNGSALPHVRHADTAIQRVRPMEDIKYRPATGRRQGRAPANTPSSKRTKWLPRVAQSLDDSDGARRSPPRAGPNRPDGPRGAKAESEARRRRQSGAARRHRWALARRGGGGRGRLLPRLQRDPSAAAVCCRAAVNSVRTEQKYCN